MFPTAAYTDRNGGCRTAQRPYTFADIDLPWPEPTGAAACMSGAALGPHQSNRLVYRQIAANTRRGKRTSATRMTRTSPGLNRVLRRSIAISPTCDELLELISYCTRAYSVPNYG